jgi:hypothetical protein
MSSHNKTESVWKFWLTDTSDAGTALETELKIEMELGAININIIVITE